MLEGSGERERVREKGGRVSTKEHEAMPCHGQFFGSETIHVHVQFTSCCDSLPYHANLCLREIENGARIKLKETVPSAVHGIYGM